MRERLEKAGYEVERNLLFCLLGDYGNYKRVKKYTTVDDFNCEEYKNIFTLISILYDSANFKSISKYTIKTISYDKGMSNDDIATLESFVDMASMVKEDMDFEGTYSLFRKINGMRKLVSGMQKYGGFENYFFNLYEKSNNAEEIKNGIDNVAKACFKEYRVAIQSCDMSKGMVDYIKNEMFVSDGNSIPFDRNFFFLQQYSKGIHVGVTFWGSWSGMGKTSLVIPFFCIPILENGQKLLCIGNEQTANEFRQLFLMAYVSLVKKDTKGIFRQNMNYEGRNRFTPEQYEYMCECAREFEERYNDRLQFVFTPRFTEDELESLIEEYHRLGYNNVLLDTFKQEDSTNGWEGMDNMAKRMDGLSKDLGLKIICTVQLAQHVSWRRYLTANCIGKAKSIKEVATSLYMFRWLRPEEIPNIKYQTLKRDETTGKLHPVTMDLEPYYIDKHGEKRNKNYIALFNDKQRKSECGHVIIYEADLGRMYFREMGITYSIKNDDNGK